MTAAHVVGVPERERIESLDFVRGIALFGILVVNMAFFAQPMSTGILDPGLAEDSPVERVAWWIEATFFQSKFISTFSFLFGAGLTLQMARLDRLRADAIARGAKARSTAWTILRRMALLAVFGLIHALGIWYGDILFFYATMGWILIPLRFLSARVLAIGAIALMVISFGCTASFSALQMLGLEQQEAAMAAAAESSEPAETVDAEAEAAPEIETLGAIDAGAESDDAAPYPFTRVVNAIRDTQGNIFDERWAELETELYSKGPWAEVAVLRLIEWGFVLPVMYLVYSPHILAMFLFGMAAAKAGSLLASAATVQRLAAVIGIPIGVLLCGIGASATWSSGWEPSWNSVVGQVSSEVGAFASCLGYVGALCLIVYSGFAPRVCAAIARTGRMAFTVYIAESVVMTGIMYWWGGGYFGEFSRVEQFAIAVVAYVALVLVSDLWLRLFRMGPLEWIWRAGTYLELPAMRRAA